MGRSGLSQKLNIKLNIIITVEAA